jgi:hypothetical protein
MTERVEAIGSEAILSDNIEILPKVNDLDSRLDSIIAKLELEVHFANWRWN